MTERVAAFIALDPTDNLVESAEKFDVRFAGVNLYGIALEGSTRCGR